MVNNTAQHVPARTAPALPVAGTVVRVYLAVVVATLIVLTVLSFTAPQHATGNAWGHAIVVAVFAVVLPLRLRAAQQRRPGALRAVGLIAAALFVVNVVEALVPGFVPTWMRAQMWVTAALMVPVVLEVVRSATSERR